MSLNKVNYVDNVTIIGADNLNEIQDAIISLESGGGAAHLYSLIVLTN